MVTKQLRATRSVVQHRKTARRVRSSPCSSTYKSAEREVFAHNVCAARSVLGWSQTELGYRVVGESSYVGLVEAGQINISIDRMATFAQAIGQPLYKLLERSFALPKGAKAPSPATIMRNWESKTRELSSSRGRIPKAAERGVFGENIRTARLVRGLTQGEVAHLLRFNINTISPVEAGQTNTSIDRMAAFARLFELPLHRLLRP